MAYDVLSDDLFDNDDKKSHKKHRKRNTKEYEHKKTESSKPQIRAFHIHLALILITIGLLLYFFSDISESFTSSDDEGEFLIIAKLEDFNHTYSGDLKLESKKFTIHSRNGIFDDKSGEILIKNYSGEIILENKSIVFMGVGDTIEYKRNKISLDSSEFTLTSSRKTIMSLFFHNLTLNISSGTARLDDFLNYKLSNSEIALQNYNATIVHDGSFTFSGQTDNFVITSPQSNLRISYEK